MEPNREQILKNAEYESEISDLKQHADKMLRGFESFNALSANRAIWEMIQNACDLTTECEVIIDYSGEHFSFTHNGKPFTTKSLISLIKQVSGKYGEESITEVGKYGTGFLTTHTFGRQFLLNSVLQAGDTHFEIKDFLVDRRPKEWRSLSSKIKEQKDSVYTLIKEATVITAPIYKTRFTYIAETEQELEYRLNSARDLDEYFPIVLTINERLKKVKVCEANGNIKRFERINKSLIDGNDEFSLYKTLISTTDGEIVIYSIVGLDDDIEILLPIDKELNTLIYSNNIAKLFLYYPLVGSEDFGINFIINATTFLPTEARDGIHLMSNKDQVKDQEEINREIISKASALIFNFLTSNLIEINNPLLLAKINFKRNSENLLLNDYFEDLQQKWTSKFKQLPIVKTAVGFIPADEACFFSEELLQDDTVFAEIYEIASQFYDNLPSIDTIALWSSFVQQWTDEEITFIGHKDLFSFISSLSLESFKRETLITYYKSLIQEGIPSYFSQYALLPNKKGQFSLLPDLLIAKEIDEVLLEVGEVLIPSSTSKLIDEDFHLSFNCKSFTRRDFSNDVKTMLDDIDAGLHICIPSEESREQYNLSSGEKFLERNFFDALLKYCMLKNNVDSKSKPSELIRIICQYYEIDDNFIFLPNTELPEEGLNIRTARKILVQIFFNLLELHKKDWVAENIGLLYEIGNYNDDSLKEAYMDAAIYPSQTNELRQVIDLKRDIDGDWDMVELYNRVTSTDIRQDLIYRQFNTFVAEDRYVDNKYLASAVEQIFFQTESVGINDHPFKDDILSVIAKISSAKYKALFPILDREKAKLMLDVVTNENTKDDIFSIVVLKENQLRQIGQLVQHENFEAILQKAAIVLQQEIHKKSDFMHKYKIGTRIEGLIREKLSSQLSERISFVNQDTIEASNEQGGQDIIVLLDGAPVYYIEVKSRWDSESSVTMSKLQLQRAVETETRYALCSVDISKYNGQTDKYALAIDEILPLTKFVTNIGSSIKPLIVSNLFAEKNQEQNIHLIDYRGVVPQRMIGLGNEFDSFINILIEHIEKASISAAQQN
ncbi:hypothetical protein KJK34_03455 [Flavobacterium sp. D11R37]|uniref:sacsin N-terminal ATP-binding-like domain-containing protein n=1 Tax=Flavobacterium coralii TaxID=2838017 RepID=UPI001CA6ECC1|nr:hypothetical protein [Flavobacterium coralii]MBY8961803.1 hypothetical protein [Flavobacterium coralii]